MQVWWQNRCRFGGRNRSGLAAVEQSRMGKKKADLVRAEWVEQIWAETQPTSISPIITP